ncbi:hypothetical protein [Alkalimarinus coralli]|uniref:hypothetical protein n=1 Tax=Alkalimarinus coralli TaxID=2935863 RepID=UPI00202B44C5|nr:hypothetical protein [Alkalimarinus coralli]
MNQNIRSFLTSPQGLFSFFVLLSVALKLFVIDVGAPYIMMDDANMFSGGFLVWFGQAPPQRMYIESWFSGLSSMTVYITSQLLSGNASALNLNIVAEAYADFNQNPYPYVTGYRYLMLLFDMLTVLFVFKTAQIVFATKQNGQWFAALAASLYLMSYNTLWCNVVSRPDTGAALFASAGLYLYYKSKFGNIQTTLWCSALLMGLSTGYKLHCALFVVFILFDMWRVLGFKTAFKRCFQFGLISFVAFLVASGSAIFDPLLYAKLRALNVKDDASPWIEWGDQVAVVFNGTGWLALPLLIGAMVPAWKNRNNPEYKAITSIVFLATFWVILFLSIRQLRAYWMLPALPLIYMAAVSVFTTVKSRAIIVGVSVIALSIVSFQTIKQAYDLKQVKYNELSEWIETNVDSESAIYIYGYEALNLPKNTQAINNMRKGIERKINNTLASEKFTYRHIRNWEERATLKLYSMLEFQSKGYEYYGYYVAPLDEFKGILSLDDMDYVIFLEGFMFPEIQEVKRVLEYEFKEVASVVGPGGGSKGLRYQVYKRKSFNAQ